MIVLDENGVIEAVTVGRATAATHRALFEGAVARRCLPGTDNGGVCMCNLVGECARHGGDGGQAAQEIQHRPFGDQDGPG